MEQKNSVYSKTDENKKIKWKPISEYDYSRKDGKVLLRGPYYLHDTELECKNVKFAYHATMYAEIDEQ